MRHLRTFALVIPLVFGSGCFVFDELDAGMEIMESHTPADKKKAKQAGQKAEGEKPPTYQESLQAWWGEAKSINVSKEARLAEDDPMVPCKHQGKTVFTRRSDCVARGGSEG